jgi:hypothetical protein
MSKNTVKCKFSSFKPIIYRLQRQVQRISPDGKKIEGRVEYDVPYAVRIHEDLKMFHSNGRAKFLEEPYRQMRADGTLSKIVKREMARGRTLRQAIRTAMEFLKQASQAIVPVKTGRLKRSAKVITEVVG